MRLTWSFYDQKTGLLTGRTFLGLPEYLAANTPTGCAAVEGRFDHLAQRVDIHTGDIVNDAAMADENRRRREQQQRRDHAARRIATLERQQLRPMRELQLDPNNATARSRLSDIERKVSALRVDLVSDTDATAPEG